MNLRAFGFGPFRKVSIRAGLPHTYNRLYIIDQHQTTWIAADNGNMHCCASAQREDAEAREARLKSREIQNWLKEEHRKDTSTLKLLLLGPGESGKSTITKQMKIIHANGFTEDERRSKIRPILKNILESIVTLVSAVEDLGDSFTDQSCYEGARIVREQAQSENFDFSQGFYDHIARIWNDPAIQRCYNRAAEFQLLDCAKYFLDLIEKIRQDDYLPNDQDILQCRVMTTGIAQFDFAVKDRHTRISFSMFDVGGQRGERRKWIQLFECVTAIVFVADCSSFDQTLREDNSTNRLIESFNIFNQVWNNRFLRDVSVILFVNKIDRLKEKVESGATVRDLWQSYLKNNPPKNSELTRIWSEQLNYDTFEPSAHEKKIFEKMYPSDKRELNEDVIKNATFITSTFQKIVSFEHPTEKEKHAFHGCNMYYTCAVNTNQIQIVMESCRSIIVQKHLERFGIA